MKPFIKPKYLYYTLPFIHVFASVVIMFNYAFAKDFKKVFFFGMKFLFFSFGVLIFIPTIVEEVFKSNIMSTIFGWIYVYAFSTTFGIHIIKEQIAYYELKNKKNGNGDIK